METILQKLEAIDWHIVANEMHAHGYTVIPGLAPHNLCHELISNYDDAGMYRKTITMERYRFGLGEYKYFTYPLPALIGEIRARVYEKLVPIARTWMKVLNIPATYPDTFDTFRELCHANHQVKPTVLILKYGEGGHNTLHQDLYGELFFPIQLVLFLNEPDADYTGGEFVLTQQTPRAQSKAIVLKPRKGDLLIFTTNFRPVQGTKGYYRVQMKHGVSEVRSGERHTLGIIFHDAIT